MMPTLKNGFGLPKLAKGSVPLAFVDQFVVILVKPTLKNWFWVLTFAKGVLLLCFYWITKLVVSPGDSVEKRTRDNPRWPQLSSKDVLWNLIYGFRSSVQVGVCFTQTLTRKYDTGTGTGIQLAQGNRQGIKIQSRHEVGEILQNFFTNTDVTSG